MKEKIIKQGKPLGLDFDYMKNKKRHQYRASECGMYCIYFIIQMLTTDKSFEELSNNTRRNQKKFSSNKREFYKRN